MVVKMIKIGGQNPPKMGSKSRSNAPRNPGTYVPFYKGGYKDPKNPLLWTLKPGLVDLY